MPIILCIGCAIGFIFGIFLFIKAIYGYETIEAAYFFIIVSLVTFGLNFTADYLFYKLFLNEYYEVQTLMPEAQSEEEKQMINEKVQGVNNELKEMRLRILKDGDWSKIEEEIMNLSPL